MGSPTLPDELSWFPQSPTVIDATLNDDGRLEFDQEALPKQSYITYGIALPPGQFIPRASGKTMSRLLYVGQGSRQRIVALRSGKHSCLQALDQFRRARGLEIVKLQLWISPAENCTLYEAYVLNRVVRAHGELPPANRRWEGYLTGTTLREMVKWSINEQSGYRVWSPYEYPYKSPLSVWVDVHAEGKRGSWLFSLGWIHSRRLLDINGLSDDVPLALQGRILLLKPGTNRNALIDIPVLKDWSIGEIAPDPVDASCLDGLDPDERAVKAWLEMYTIRAWSQRGDPCETLYLTLQGAR